MEKPHLYIGNKNYSSWSLRPWLVLRWAGIAFDETVIPLGGPGYGRGQIAAVKAISPSGRVPALRLGDRAVWDSLAIAEWAAEIRPDLWPADAGVRAECRSATAEMHSGFSGIRRDLSMNIRARLPARSLPDDTRAELDRLFALWSDLRARYGAGGPWLFGERTIADAFYTPVATRLRTYSVEAPPGCAAYCATLLADPAFQAWETAAEAEPWEIA